MQMGLMRMGWMQMTVKKNQSKRKKKKKLTAGRCGCVVNMDGSGGTVDDSACVQGEFGLRDFVRVCAATIPD